MALYTGRGDKGETDLMGGPRVRKDHPRVVALGEVDELNAALGVVIASLGEGEIADLLLKVQNDLFTVGAELSLSPEGRPVKRFNPLQPSRVGWLEDAIDRLAKEIGPQRAFVLPGGIEGAAFLHFARSVCRRVERRLVSLSSEQSLNPQVLRYVNRLSSLLYAFALKVNKDAGVEERNPTYP